MSDSITFSGITCPYCGHENKRTIKKDEIHQYGYVSPMVDYCDPEDGGCDQFFVLDIKVMAEITVKKVEGYQ